MKSGYLKILFKSNLILKSQFNKIARAYIKHNLKKKTFW